MHGDMIKALQATAIPANAASGSALKGFDAASRLAARSMKGALAAQGHMLSFVQKRLNHDLATAKALSGCTDMAKAMGIAQDHAVQTAADYAEEMTALTRIGATAIGDGEPAA